MDRMEREMDGLQREFKAVSASYGDTVLNLVVGSGYLSNLIGNPRLGGYSNATTRKSSPNSEPLSQRRRWRKAAPGYRQSPPSWVEVARSTALTRAARPQYQVQ